MSLIVMEEISAESLGGFSVIKSCFGQSHQRFIFGTVDVISERDG